MALTSTLNIPYLTLWLVCIRVVMVMLLFVVNQIAMVVKQFFLLAFSNTTSLVTAFMMCYLRTCQKLLIFPLGTHGRRDSHIHTRHKTV